MNLMKFRKNIFESNSHESLEVVKFKQFSL